MPSLHAVSVLESESPSPRRKIPARLRRVNRAHETDASLIAASVPYGSVRAAHGDQVMAHLLNRLSERRMRADGHRARVAVLACLIARADYETMTTRPGWDALAEAAQCTTRSVARILAQLEAWGLLGRVAGGRQAQYAAAGPDGERINEAAVYVLCAPSPLALVAKRTEERVDINVIPPALGGTHLNKKKLTPTRARERTSFDAATPRQIISPAASGDPTPPPPYRPELQWPTHRTTKTPLQRLAAAAELRNQIFLLRPMSTKDLRSSLRDFFVAGWTTADIRHALEWLPDGSHWPHDSVPNLTHLCRKDAATRLRGWLAYRLQAWRTDSGEPFYSPSQRVEADRRQQLALQAIERRRVLEEQAQHVALMHQPVSAEKARALATIHAMKIRNRSTASRWR